MDIGGILKLCRLAAGFTQEEMASTLSFENNSTISKLENNSSSAKMDTILKWCEITGHKAVVVALLMGVDEDTIKENLKNGSFKKISV